MSTRFLKLAGLIAALALVAAACSTSNGSAAPEDELEPGPPDTTEQAASSGNVFYLMGDDDTRQWPLDAGYEHESGVYPPISPEPATPENQAAYNDAIANMQAYITLAWIAPFDAGESDWDRIGEWVQILDDSASDKWGLGPTYATGETAWDVPAGDLRITQWMPVDELGVEPGQQPPAASYDYLLYRLATSTPAEDESRVPYVLIERTASGALEAVYVKWGTEVGFTYGNPDVTRPQLVALNTGLAKLVPAGASEGNLRIATLDADPLPFPGFYLDSQFLLVYNDGGKFSPESPALIREDRFEPAEGLGG